MSFKNENEFKNWFLGRLRNEAVGLKGYEVYTFCIESPETAQGFPDSMVFTYNDKNKSKSYYFAEFKVVDKNGNFTFEKTQIPFYLRHPLMDIRVIVLDDSNDRYFRFDMEDFFVEALKEEKKLTFNVNDLAKRFPGNTYTYSL